MIAKRGDSAPCFIAHNRRSRDIRHILEYFSPLYYFHERLFIIRWFAPLQEHRSGEAHGIERANKSCFFDRRRAGDHFPVADDRHTARRIERLQLLAVAGGFCRARRQQSVEWDLTKGNMNFGRRQEKCHAVGFRDSERSNSMLRLSRVELYDLVWSKPMTEISRRFGIRDQYVAQACDCCDIARPHPGHWQKIEYGRSVERVALSNAEFSANQLIMIDKAGWRMPRDRLDEPHEIVRRRAA